MQSHLPAGDRRAVVFATTTDGLRLPVIDVTNPEFAVPDDPASLAARRDAFLAWDRRNRRMPKIVTRLLTRLAARRSPLLRKMLASDEYLDSISTYMVKLGADHPAARLRRSGGSQGRGGSAFGAGPPSHAAARPTAGGGAPSTAR
jgi:hypothetical protein